MQISIWNIYHRLSYSVKIPLVRDGSATIKGIRWIVSKDLNSDMAYIGNEGEFFAGVEGNTIIVHRNDMILVKDAEPQEVFNEVSSIMEMYQRWDEALEICGDKSNGLTEMLAASAEIFQNPAFIYAPDGKALAISQGYPPSIHWHWAEILEHRGLTEERMGYLQKAIGLTDVFQDRTPTVHDFGGDEPQYLHCSLVVNGYMAGHFVIFGMCRPFESGDESLAAHLIGHMLRYMDCHYEIYSPTSRLGACISAIVHERPYEKREFLLLQRLLGWNDTEELYQLYLLKEMVKGEPVMTSRTYRKLSDALKNSVVVQENDLLLLLVNLNHASQKPERLEPLISSLAPNFCCGISTPFRHIDQAGRYYRQALGELIRCREQGLHCSRGADHIGDHLLSLLGENPLNETYVVPELRTLLEHDQREQTHYYETLRAWFYSGFHPASAAAMLLIHRNSFLYRMERIRELIPFDAIDDAASALDPRIINEYLYSFMYLDTVDSPQ